MFSCGYGSCEAPQGDFLTEILTGLNIPGFSGINTLVKDKRNSTVDIKTDSQTDFLLSDTDDEILHIYRQSFGREPPKSTNCPNQAKKVHRKRKDRRRAKGPVQSGSTSNVYHKSTESSAKESTIKVKASQSKVQAGCSEENRNCMKNADSAPCRSREGSDSNYVSQTEHSGQPSDGNSKINGGVHLPLGIGQEWEHLPWLQESRGAQRSPVKAQLWNEGKHGRNRGVWLNSSSDSSSEESTHFPVRLSEDWVYLPWYNGQGDVPMTKEFQCKGKSCHSHEPHSDSSEKWTYIPWSEEPVTKWRLPKNSPENDYDLWSSHSPTSERSSDDEGDNNRVVSDEDDQNAFKRDQDTSVNKVGMSGGSVTVGNNVSPVTSNSDLEALDDSHSTAGDKAVKCEANDVSRPSHDMSEIENRTSKEENILVQSAKSSPLADRPVWSLSRFGKLKVTFAYYPASSTMKVTIHSGVQVPTVQKGLDNNTQVHIVLLPSEKPHHRTHIKSSHNPIFEQSFNFKIFRGDLAQMGVYFCLYGCKKWKRHEIIGEYVFTFDEMSMSSSTSTHTLELLEPGAVLEMRRALGSTSRVEDMIFRSEANHTTTLLQTANVPRLMLTLRRSDRSGRFVVEVVKGNNLAEKEKAAVTSTYVKIQVLDINGKELIDRKSTKQRGQHPFFKEKFLISVPMCQWKEVTLLVSAYRKVKGQKQTIGWFCMGYNSSSEEEHSHWKDMLLGKSANLSRLHTLIHVDTPRPDDNNNKFQNNCTDINMKMLPHLLNEKRHVKAA